MSYYVYIVSNEAHTLYVGLTDNLPKRVAEHRDRSFPSSFTARYTFNRLVHFEVFQTAAEAAAREKQIKGWRRAKKIALIQEHNPRWHDLNLDLGHLLRLK